jgi:integrase
MRGTIFKRKGASTYSVIIELGRDPTTGKRRQKWHAGYKSKKEAERALVELLGNVQQGTYVEPSKLTLVQFLRDEWLPAKQAQLRPTTYEAYRMNCATHIIPALGGRRIQELQPGMLNSFYRSLLNGGRSDGKGGLSPKTVRHIHGIIHKALRDAGRLGYVPRNVAEFADLPTRAADADTTAPTELQVWSPTELRAFLAGVAGDRLAAAWRLAATTGMRRGEILGLRWSDVDLEAGRLAVRVARVRAGNAVVASRPKTRAGQRVLHLDEPTVAALRTWRREQLQERMLVGPRFVDSGLVFTMSDGSPITPNRFSIWFRAHVKRLGLPRIRLHDVRHSYATAALAAGVPVKIVSQRIGHATTGITLDTYSHVIPGMDSAAAAQVAAIIDG